jgi:hypothetical protein
MYLTYETLMLLLALAFLVGALARPARAVLRSILRAHRAAKRASRPVIRKRRRRAKKVSTP